MSFCLLSLNFKPNAEMRPKQSVSLGHFLMYFYRLGTCRLTRVGVSKLTSVKFKTNYRETIKQYQTIIEHFYRADVFTFFFSALKMHDGL